MTWRTKLTDQYGCGFPLVQAGLAFVGVTPALAIALSRRRARRLAIDRCSDRARSAIAVI